MPDMNTVYQQHATQYDKLVNAEDHNKNLPALLQKLINWEDQIVYEAGIGTGRVSRIFIDQIKHLYGFDRAEHMLAQCGENLKNDSDKITLAIGDNSDLPLIDHPADIVIEGWSFGHTIIDYREEFKIHFQKMLNRIKTILKPGGVLIIIETEGTNVDTPGTTNPVLKQFYHHLEHQLNFTHHTIPTDYRFETVTEAVEVLGFFFGEQMKAAILERNSTIIPEFTGIWMQQF